MGYLNFEFVGECGILKGLSRKGTGCSGCSTWSSGFCVYDNYTNKLYLAISRRTDASDAEDAYQEIARELDRVEASDRGARATCP